MPSYEVNFDGLVGQTHNYGGLSEDNLASSNHKSLPSNPKEAALQGLHKMKLLADLGLKQAFLPPHERPNIPFLRRLGFSGTNTTILEKAKKQAPEIFQAASSASAMWTANAATVTPRTDTPDNKTHLTPANLFSKLHRSIEPATTFRILKSIFHNEHYFNVHPPLPASFDIADEGAANHTRLSTNHSSQGLHFFVYGRNNTSHKAQHYTPRQTLAASQAIARKHLLTEHNTFFAQQHPTVIDSGVFHNDVIATGNEDLFLYHELAYADGSSIIQNLKEKFFTLTKQELICIEVPTNRISLKDAVKSYLFNSQLITLPDNSMLLLAPNECLNFPHVADFLNELTQNPLYRIKKIQYLDLHQSMQNGGGPACLRLRVPLNEQELSALPASIFINDHSYPILVNWVTKHYRDHLTPNDLADSSLLSETHTALDELTQILGLGKLYDFQQ